MDAVKKYWWLIGIIGFVVFLVGLKMWIGSRPGEFDGFAQCLADKHVVFYGAFWCPHCQAQKAMFGNSARLLPYVECSTPDGKGQKQICKEKDIQSYPVWEFSDGSRLSGEQTLDELAAKSGCTL